MVHDLDPFVLQFTADFGIRWYGLSYLAGFACAFFMIAWLANRQRAGLSVQMVNDFITWGAIGTLVGGRLGYVFFYSPDLLWKFKSSFPFWGVLAVNEGGMASHGGMIGIVVAILLFARKYSLNSLYLLDLATVVGPIGVFFGRLANFVNGELVGRPAPEGYKWAVKFPQDILSWPAQSFEKLRDLTPVVEKVGVSSEQWLNSLAEFNANATARNSVYDVLNQIIVAIQNGNTAAKEAIAPLLIGRYPSQIFAAFGEGLFIFLFLFFMWRKPRKPGFITASFLIVYALIRIWDEQFRMPDAHIGYQLFDLTRGQWLSIGMLVIGVVLMLVWTRAGDLKVSGWGRGQSVKLNRK